MRQKNELSRPDLRNYLFELSSLSDIVSAVRAYFGMEFAFIAQVARDNIITQNVSAPGLEGIIKEQEEYQNSSAFFEYILEIDKIDYSFCDTRLGVFKYISPFKMLNLKSFLLATLDVESPDRRVIFLCGSSKNRADLDRCDALLGSFFSDLIRCHYRRNDSLIETDKSILNDLNNIINNKELDVVYQPIVNLKNKSIVGFEALSRFVHSRFRTPDAWFREARRLNLLSRLELVAISKALDGFDFSNNTSYLSLNISASTLLHREFLKAIEGVPSSRLVLEIIEHEPLDCYGDFSDMLQLLRSKGVRIAIDDLGAGFASLNNVINIKPDIVKLDLNITRNIHIDSARAALVAGLVYFAREMSTILVAEGIENEDQCKLVADLGVDLAQGYFLGLPNKLA